jgi:DNA mismatch repair protein MutS
MIQQYLSIKREAQDALLFFRLGDFYEMFFEDAVLAARELEITLTGRDGGAEDRVPMCGVPYHSADSYISRLVEKGYKVAICEQVEDPASAKGVVRREIVRFVTPGTVMEGKTLEDHANNYIVSLGKAEGEWGLAACDLSTGELHVTSTSELSQLWDEVLSYRPSEVLGDEPLLESARNEAAWLKSPLFTSWEQEWDAALLQRFSREEQAKLAGARLEAVCRLLSYLEATQKRLLTHVTHIRDYEPGHFMILDAYTKRNLELIETVRDRTKKGSLLWLLDRTLTSMGARMLRRIVDKPLLDLRRIEERLEAVDVLHSQLILREELRELLKKVYDLERIAGRISYGSANARDLVSLKISLDQVPDIRRLCAESPSATLAAVSAGMDDCADLAALIDAAIVDDPPVSVRDGGLIKNGYDERLDQLREASANGKSWLAELEKREREATGIKSLKIGYNKVFGYYIEVSKANAANLPEGRYERKQTLANAERYVTPELKEKESLILEAEERMVDLEYEMFAAIRGQIAAQAARLQRLAEQIAYIDVLQSFASVSAEHRFTRPVVTDRYDLVIQAGRHPVVEAMTNSPFIANDTELRDEAVRMMLITGPNMAGKSTYMRQVAYICIMAQIGCFVPAERAEIPLIDRVFTRIGAADDLIGGQSTFMVEMTDIRQMTEKATRRSLVIIDELGRGTSTGEGMSIAQAVIEYLHDRIGCKTLVSTHFHELACLEDRLAHLANHSMAVEESGDRVTFLRRLVPGAAGTSYGIYCARLAGLPDSIIGRAYELLSEFERRASSGMRPDARGAAFEMGPLEAAAGAVQLSMFDEELPVAKDNRDKTGAAAGSDSGKSLDTAAKQVIKRLKDADLIRMTPLDAMNLLFELKQKL